MIEFTNTENESHFIISKISHELKNTLTLVSSSLQLIEQSHEEVAQFQFWPEIKSDISYLRLLLDDLSTCNNSHQINRTPFSLLALLKNLESSFDGLAVKEGKHLYFSYPEDLPEIKGDCVKLRQVFTNLLKNAFESIPKGGTVSLSASLEHRTFLCKISDNGVGMTKEQLKTIFTPYVTYKENGTGIGLPIAKQLIEAHGGRLFVESNPGIGSVFTVSLPDICLATSESCRKS